MWIEEGISLFYVWFGFWTRVTDSVIASRDDEDMFKSIRFSNAQVLAVTALSCALVSACASRSEPRTAEQALPKRQASTEYQFGPDCSDPRNRALRRDVSAAEDPTFTHCHPDYYVIQGRPSAVRGPILERGSINLPQTPVPLPEGLGVFRR